MTILQKLFRLGCAAALAILVAYPNARADEGDPAVEGHPLDQIPMYGEGRLPEELQKANRELVRDAYKTGASLTSASNTAIDEGWEALSTGDTKTAIRRFNQAWLLDRRNGAVYWGFGVVLYERDSDVKGALKMLRRAHRLQPQNPYLLVDYGRVLEENGKAHEAAPLFLDAVSIDANTKYVYVGLVRAYLKSYDLENALLFAFEGKDHGDPISDELIAALEDLSKSGAVLTAEVKLPAVPEWAQ